LAAAISAVSARSAFSQTAYFSTQGDFVNASSLQDFFVTTSRLITSSEALRFETFSSRGTTANAAGDTSPTIAHGFDSNLTLTNQFSSGTFTNDDGADASGNFLDSNLSWNGVAPNGGGNLGTSLTSSLYRLRLNEFNNDIGPWGVDLVGPANAMTFGGFASAGGVSTTRSIKFGTDGVADLNAPANQHARFLHNTGGPLTVTGDFVVANTGNASYVGSSTTAASLTVGGETRVNRGGDITLGGPHILNANGGYIVDGGRVVLNGTSRINVASGTTFIDLVNGGRMDVNAGTTFDAPGSRLDFGFGGNATENLLVVVDGVVNTREAFIGESTDTVGRATINGANGRWNLTQELIVGSGGQGVLEVTTGAKVSNSSGHLGFFAGGVGTAILTGTGATWTNTDNLTLGRPDGTSTGTLTITSGGRLNVGDTASTNDFETFSFIEDERPITPVDPTDGGILSVFAGSTLNNTANSGLSIGRGVDRRGSVLVSGTGATINDNNTFLGFQGAGTLTINAGGKYIANNAFFAIGINGSATVTVDGANSQLWSKGDLELGGNGGSGTITTTNGGTVLVGDSATGFASDRLIVSDADPASANAGGKLTIANGSTLNHHSRVILAPATNTYASVLVTGTNSAFEVGQDLFVGNVGGGVADVSVESGGRIAVAGSYQSPGGNAGTHTTTVTGANSRLEAGNIFVSTTGATSSHLFTVSAGGRAQSTFQVVLGEGQNASGVATVTGADSTIAVGTLLEVGREGTGTLNIQSAGKVTAANAVVGDDATGVGTVNLFDAGSILDVAGNLTVGALGSGSIIISNNATLAAGTLTINLSNSMIDLGRFGKIELDSGLANLRSQIQTGYNGGNWLGNGITSIAAESDARLGIGYRDSGTLITARVTLKGDTNLSLSVDFNDLLALAQNYNGTGKFWQDGDFDYNGSVDFNDLLALAQNYNGTLSLQATSAFDAGFDADFAADWALAVSMVPEPTVIALAMPVLWMTRRRRV
jgi:T5SS/PEP-CTERM-associated repeat protein